MKTTWQLSFVLFLFSAIVSRAAEPLGYAPAPNDPYWNELWHLENLDTNAARRGIDANARSAWSITRGAGVNIAVVDDGVDLNHPDLKTRAATEFHWNFDSETPAGGPVLDSQIHGTTVAGMAVAQGGNHIGMTGIAPDAHFASWVIFNTNNNPGTPYVSRAELAKMFAFHNQEVQVQNHSWVTPGQKLVSLSLEEDAALSNAVTLGRAGKGVVIVRAAGNNRIAFPVRNVNEDAYTSDPRVITVAAIRFDGRVSSYSTPGAAILVGAPSGDEGFPSPFSTDRVGSQLGFNRINFADDHADYVFAGLWNGGTSAAAPLISGIAALLLSANPELSSRDVQQILAMAADQTDPNDPGVVENGAGFKVSHNTGFGLVDAGTAVDLARSWKSRPALEIVTKTVDLPQAIPDAGLRVEVSSAGASPAAASIIALPSLGIVADDPTATLPLVYVGEAVSTVTNDLHGQAALIRRGGGSFAEKIENAARAGAEFAIMFNNQGTTTLEVMGSTDFVPIPAVFISQRDGDALAAMATNEMTFARIVFSTARIPIPVEEPLLCEHVSVDLEWEHPQRGDVRVTLVSPMGTRSVLQRLSDSLEPFSGSWTYTSTHHFYESSRGTWTVEIGDQVLGGTGLVQRATLKLRGVSMVDSDSDGLDDRWEQDHFGSLAFGPKDDPDLDGYSNAREQILGTDPAKNEQPLELGIAAWSDSIIRLNWPSQTGAQYNILGFTDLAEAPEILATVAGEFPRTAWFGKIDRPSRFLQVRKAP